MAITLCKFKNLQIFFHQLLLQLFTEWLADTFCAVMDKTLKCTTYEPNFRNTRFLPPPVGRAHNEKPCTNRFVNRWRNEKGLSVKKRDNVIRSLRVNWCVSHEICKLCYSLKIVYQSLTCARVKIPGGGHKKFRLLK